MLFLLFCKSEKIGLMTKKIFIIKILDFQENE